MIGRDRPIVVSLLSRVVCPKKKKNNNNKQYVVGALSRPRRLVPVPIPVSDVVVVVCAAYCSPPASFGSLNLSCLPRETVNERTDSCRTHERAQPTSPSPSTALAIDRGAHGGRSSVLAETLYCSDVREVDQKKPSSKKQIKNEAKSKSPKTRIRTT